MADELRPIAGVTKQIVGETSEAVFRHSEASMITLRGGELLLLVTEFVHPEFLSEAERPASSRLRGVYDDFYGRIVGYVSGDGGATWQSIGVVVDDKDALVNCMSPALARLPDGRLLLAYSWRSGGNAGKGNPSQNGPAAKRVRFSEDEGRTWSEPMAITPNDGNYHAGGHDRAYTLPSGRVLVQIHSRFEQEGPYESWRRMTNWVAYSDDNGATWQRSTRLDELRSSRGFAEATIADRQDGSLLMAMRTTLGHVFFTRSADEGATWSAPYSSGIVAPAAPTLVARIPGTDDLLLVWNPGYSPEEAVLGVWGYRNTLLCAISRDNGATWGLPKVIESDLNYWWEYPGIHFHGDQALLYYHKVAKKRDRFDLVLAHIPLSWFYEEASYEPML